MDNKKYNQLNIWSKNDYPVKWYRPDLKVKNFFRKVKWTWQRAKYGWCDRDLWDLEYTLGNYIASSTEKLAEITHGYPPNITEEKWDNILKKISEDFYFGVNEDYYENPYEEEWFNSLTPEKEELWKKLSDREIEIHKAMSDHLHNGFVALEKWFPHLWD